VSQPFSEIGPVSPMEWQNVWAMWLV